MLGLVKNEGPHLKTTSMGEKWSTPWVSGQQCQIYKKIIEKCKKNNNNNKKKRFYVQKLWDYSVYTNIKLTSAIYNL